MIDYRDAFDLTDFGLYRLEGFLEALDTLVAGHELLAGTHPKTSAIYAVIDGMRGKLTAVREGREVEWGIIAGAGFLGAKSATCPGAPGKVNLPNVAPQSTAEGGAER